MAKRMDLCMPTAFLKSPQSNGRTIPNPKMAQKGHCSLSYDAIRAFCQAVPDGAVVAQFLCELKQRQLRNGISVPFEVLCRCGLPVAALGDRLDVVRGLCHFNMDDGTVREALVWAASRDQTRVVRYLCELPSTVDVDFTRLTTLWMTEQGSPIREVMLAALARQQRWTPGRAAWAGAVAVASSAVCGL